MDLSNVKVTKREYQLVRSWDRTNHPFFRSKIIPILYFPKTRPMDPPLASIPKPPSDYLQSASPNVHLSEHVDTFPLTPQWSSSHAKRASLGLERFKKSVFVCLFRLLAFT